MMNDKRRRILFWFKLKFFTQLNLDARGIEQFEKLCLVFQIRTSGIAKAESRPLVTLAKKFIKILRVLIGDAQFLPDVFVPILSQRFGTFHAEAVKIEIVGIIIALEKFL